MLDFTVMLLGPKAVGKTSLLATMYDELTKMRENAGFGLYAENDDTSTNLGNAYLALSKVIENERSKSLEERKGTASIKPLLEGNRGITNHRFEIKFQGKKEMKLSFCDNAGGLIGEGGEINPDYQEFQRQLNQSNVIICVIDGAGMMEYSDEFFLKNSRIEKIKELLETALQKNQSHLILFVITKCEAWLNDKEGKKLLKEKFDQRFGDITQLITKQGNAAGVLIPVKTLGCVEFTSMKKEGEEESLKFDLIDNKQFKPEFTDQPLRYALSFILSQREKNLRWWEFWKKNKAFKDSLFKFTQKCDPSFEIYGDSKILRVTAPSQKSDKKS